MSNMKKMFNLAKKAIDSRGAGERGAPQGGSSSGATDWRAMVHRAADAVTGEPRHQQSRPSAPGADVRPDPHRPRTAPPAVSPQDRAAIARYNYLLETAEPGQLEQVHAEAFAKLTPSQRALLQEDLNRSLAPGERPVSTAPADRARAATRSEARNPGSLRRLLSGASGAARGGGGRGALAAGAGAVGLLGLVAGGAIATSIGGSLLAEAAGAGVDFDALAGGLDPEAMMGDFAAGDALSGLGDAVPGVEDAVAGAGDTAGSALDAAQGGLGSLGEAISGFDVRGFFDR